MSSDLNNRVLQFNGATGAYVNDFIGAGSGGLSDPHGLIFRADGLLYVSGGSSVRRYDDGTGAFVDQFASSGQLVRATYTTFTLWAVPEPSGLAMLAACGFGSLAYARRRRRAGASARGAN